MPEAVIQAQKEAPARKSFRCSPVLPDIEGTQTLPVGIGVGVGVEQIMPGRIL